jgi:hypothetical protein
MTFTTWNIDGIKGKQFDIDFIHYIKKHDVIGLIETWTTDNNDFKEVEEILDDYKLLVVKHGVKLSRHGRASGGILIFVKKCVFEFFNYVEDFDCGVIVNVENEIFNDPVLYVVCYLPPSGSSFYKQSHYDSISNGVAILEEKLSLLKIAYPHHNLIVTGDFNARTKDLQDYIQDDSPAYLPLPDFYPVDSFQIKRKTKDMHGELNEYGKLLIELCCTFGIHVLNGRTHGDINGELTCYTGNGTSLVDYTIISTSLHNRVIKFEISNQDQYTHLPQSFALKSGINVHKTKECPQHNSDKRDRPKYVWTEQSMDKLMDNNMIPAFYKYVNEGNTDEAVATLVSLLQDVSKEKHTNAQRSKPYIKKHPWWDDDLAAAKTIKHKCLRHMKHENTQIAKSKYRSARNRFKALVKFKKNRFKLNLRKRLELCTSSSEFWKFVKGCKVPHRNSKIITTEQWQLYFNELLNTRNEIEIRFKASVEDYLLQHDDNCRECNSELDIEESDVNKDVTLVEIENAIDDLKLSKAEGIDGIGNEILKNSKIVIVPMLCILFNHLLSSGIFPNEWGKAIIVPIYKNGTKEDPNNYRGISLLTCISKLFTKILNNRLVNWATENDKMHDIQAGFTKKKSTVDHIFVLQTLVTKYLAKEKGRFYSVYVDFSKAFDTVPHLHLFYSLLNGNLHGRVITVLRNMYTKLKSCVLNDGNLSEDFICTIGTRQGCMMSPFLFIFYLNELIQHVDDNNCHGIFLNEHNPNVNLLLYADDLVIVGDHIGRVQRILDALSGFCVKWGLKVNMSKTKSMVFRNGGVIKKNENLYYSGIKLENVSYYKYLGVTMSTRLSWSPAQTTLAAQARKALHVINQVNIQCEYSYTTASDIFDKCIVPILTYGSEIWGPYTHESIERVNNKFCKIQLGVGTNTPNPAVLGECGRDRLYINCIIKCVKYWMKLIALPMETLLGSCYSFLYNQCLLGKSNWVSKIRDILFRYGFGWVWEDHSFTNADTFLSMFTERLRDCEKQLWATDLQNLPKLRTYRLFKDIREEEFYLSLSIPRRLRVALARFRTGSHSLEIEAGRHKNINIEDRLCKYCGLNNNAIVIEDEYHVLFHCAAYNDVRDMYINRELTSLPNSHSFVSIMKSTNTQEIINLAHFVCSMFKIRKKNNL